MKLERLVQRVEVRLLTLGRKLLQADEKADLQEELDLAMLELAAREAELARAEARRADLQRRIASQQGAVADFLAQIQSSVQRGKSSQAMRQALELEHVRQQLAADQTELPRREQAVWSLEFTLRQMRRRLDRIREQLSGQ